MKVSGLFNEMAAEVYGSGEDRDLTSQEEQDLLDMANSMDENTPAADVFGETGQLFDGWTLPIAPCWIALIKRIWGT